MVGLCWNSVTTTPAVATGLAGLVVPDRVVRSTAN
jgi:hypothetical protein